MLTVAYCRVSTEEQATEGFSIDGQAEKLRAYASLNDLGEVTVISDPGRSGKDMERAGLQQLLAMVEAGHVSHVLLWRLDRLSRNLGDLIELADSFGRAGVALHSFTEKIDLSSATGRMFYNILGSFAQFYREQLAENVRMGMQQAAREGRWLNRPKTGYDLVNGVLVPNGDAERVREIFKLRAAGVSYQAIEDRTGIRYSTVCSIVDSRIYLGEVLLNGQWFAGKHEPLITSGEFEAAHLGHVPGRRRGRDLLSGRVFCGLCGKRMAVEQNGEGRVMYRCRHRGKGCDQPRRTNKGLHLAARLGLRLLAQDPELQAAIREELRRTGRTGQRTARRDGAAPAERLADIESARAAAGEDRERSSEREQLLARFEEVAALLQDLDLDTAWDEATDPERRVLVEELVEKVAVFPDHLEVTIAGAPRLNVGLAEVVVSSRRTLVSEGRRARSRTTGHWRLNPRLSERAPLLRVSVSAVLRGSPAQLSDSGRAL